MDKNCQVALDVQDVHAMFPRHIACLAGEFVHAHGFREAKGRVPAWGHRRWGALASLDTAKFSTAQIRILITTVIRLCWTNNSVMLKSLAV